MLNAIIRFLLRYRLVTIALAIMVTALGAYVLYGLPIDVFPDLNRPRVTVMTEAPGLSPEEVETRITLPLESALNGATNVQAVRSSSGVGLSVVYVEFDWGTDIFKDRQIVAERLQVVSDRMPEDIRPQIAPISSIMGQILIVGMWSAGEKTEAIEVRTLADWHVRRRLLTVPGVAQVVTMGGGRKQFQVLVNPDQLLKFGLSLADVERAVAASNANATGGYLEEGGRELLVRSIGRVRDKSDLENVVVKPQGDRPVLLRQVARVTEAAQVKRGDSSVNGAPAVVLVISKQPGADTRKLTDDVAQALEQLKPSLPKDIQIHTEVYKQKVFIDLSIHNVIEALRDGGILVVVILVLFLSSLRRALVTLLAMTLFVALSVLALYVFGITLTPLVVGSIGLGVMALLLVAHRMTFITLTAIPLSIFVTGLVFWALDMSINTMTLGGLAVAIGELVDDAIVDVENIFRRLRENRQLPRPKHAMRVVYEASSEVRNSIVFSTILVVLVFIPLFALSGMEGRLFTPLAIAYIVSITASLAVSLTVTPVLSYWLLPRAKTAAHDDDGALLRFLKWLAGFAIRFSIRHPWPILGSVAAMVLVAVLVVTQLGRDFLPPFNEGSVQVNVLLPPGTSLATSDHIAGMIDERLKKFQEQGKVLAFGRRTGRAELDEHAEGVNVSEIIVTLNPDSHQTREQVLEEMRKDFAEVPGTVISVEQPLAHLISHMLSGVKAQVAIKLYGEDLGTLRTKAEEMRAAIADVSGVVDLQVEQQVEIPQLRITPDRSRLAALGLTSDDINRFVETAMNGRVVSEVIQGERQFDLLVRLDDEYRRDLAKLKRLSVNLPSGGRVPLESVADIRRGSGPNTVNRENGRRRIVIQCNTAKRDLGSVVVDIQKRLAPIEAKLPQGYFVEYGGQFESQQSATQMMLLLGLVSLAAMFLALYTLFRSVNMSLQVLSALPMAAIGAVAALVLTGQSLTVASMVGFVSLAGIASRNGILLIAHYLHLVRHEGESFTPQMIERAGKERLAPMLMTALTAGIALVPLVLAAGGPGKEILYPVATVIVGGLISCTLLDFFVRPALFWLFGRRSAEHQMHRAEHDELAEVHHAAPQVPPPLPLPEPVLVAAAAEEDTDR
ncbi:MAG: efflux RND transporter permease subunit [Planctomycetia bacterium]|nr:efflux RND transporter permease subunit [Planctomycetia bacterium]